VEGILTAAEEELLQALIDHDHDAVAALLDDDFVITTAGWMADPVDKATWLTGLADHELDSFTIDVVAVRSRGPMAVVLARSHQAGRRAGEAWQHDFRYTDVWLTDGDRPRLLARHASALRPTP
jgi:hypothetical protein